ncbi:hypothetical protein L6R52_41950 [Myxococcota bacterium]|nr:hypothetical protein [Myxococcota bacterium]
MRKASAPIVTLVALGLVACTGAKDENAPVKPGDVLEYKLTTTSSTGESSATVKFKIEAGSAPDKLKIAAEPDGGAAPVEANLKLDPGAPLASHAIGQLWLTPPQRHAGTVTHVGTVKAPLVWQGRQSWPTEGAGSTHYFDTKTGFLIGFEAKTSSVASRTARLLTSTIQGL